MTKDDLKFQRLSEELDKVKYRCTCGRRAVIPARVERVVCTWCGHYVYKNKQTEFKEKLKEQMKRRK